jgi:glycine cleavage system aminomethyltransferase T
VLIIAIFQRVHKYALHLLEISLVNSPVLIETIFPNDILGVVTSGIPSPTLQKNIAIGYVISGWHKKGTEVLVEVRNKMRKGVITPMPFFKPRYWKG